MARQDRIHKPGDIYFLVEHLLPHIDICGEPHRWDSRDDSAARSSDTRARFEQCLDEAIRRWGAKVHAYCWLPGSAILLIQIGFVPLHRVLHAWHSSFSHWLSRDGAASRAYAHRYQAQAIDEDAGYLLDYVRYIYNAPVRAGLVTDPFDYGPSGLRCLLGAPPPSFLSQSGLRTWLSFHGITTKPQLKLFLGSPPRSSFATLVARGSRVGLTGRRDSRVAGGLLFSRERLRRQSRQPGLHSIEPVIAWLRQNRQVRKTLSMHFGQNIDSAELSDIAIWFAVRAGLASLRHIGRLVGRPASTVSRRMRNAERAYPEVCVPHLLADCFTFVSRWTPSPDDHGDD